MFPELWRTTVPIGQLVLRGVVIYLFVLLLLRLTGKRQIGQMGATEFVSVLLISNAVQNAMNGGDNSVTAGLVLAVTLVVLSWGISFLTFRSRRFRAVFEGTPTLLLYDGKPVEKNLTAELITGPELRTMLRKQGIHRYEDVKTAVLEADGSLSVTKVSDVAKA